MKIARLLPFLAAALLPVLGARAQSHPFQAALWAPDIQFVPATDDVSGLRLQIYGENRNVTGLDVGVANVTTGDFTGVAGVLFFVPTLYNEVSGSTTGWQVGAINVTRGPVQAWQGGLVSINRDDFLGLQTSAVNWNEPSTSDLRGVQLAFVNTAGAVEGVQLGFINYARTLRGVQLGLWNEVSSRGYGDFEPLPRVFPFINIGF